MARPKVLAGVKAAIQTTLPTALILAPSGSITPATPNAANPASLGAVLSPIPSLPTAISTSPLDGIPARLPATATATCVAAPTGGFDGWKETPPPDTNTQDNTVNAVAPGGVYSKLLATNPQLSAGSVGVGAWVMLDDYSVNGQSVNATAGHSNEDYVQIGWRKTNPAQSSDSVFVEYSYDYGSNGNQNVEDVNVGSASFQSSSYYTAIFDPVFPPQQSNEGQFTMEYASQIVWSEPAYFAPEETQNFGETHNTGDQMLAPATSPATFYDTQIYYPAGQGPSGGWHYYDRGATNGPTQVATNPKYGELETSSSPSSLEVWDDGPDC